MAEDGEKSLRSTPICMGCCCVRGDGAEPSSLTQRERQWLVLLPALAGGKLQQPLPFFPATPSDTGFAAVLAFLLTCSTCSDLQQG